MIIKKTWIVSKGGYASVKAIKYHYTAWFLLGFIPLYVSRITLAA